MALIFGADSALPATTRLTNGYDLYTWVMRQNSFPSFWGRSLSGGNQITKEEIEFLRGKGCKIALILDELTEAGVSGSDGKNDALRAVEAARTLGVPSNSGIALFAFIRPDWSVNHNWMISFAATLVNNGFVPGFIGNTDSSKNFNFDRQCNHYMNATKDAEYYGAVYWATEPTVNKVPLEWAPYCPSTITPGEIGLWKTGTTVCGDVIANRTYARDQSMLRYMW